MGNRDSLDDFFDNRPRSSLENFDFIGAFLQRVEIENRERNYRILSMTGGSTVKPPKPAPQPAPAICEQYCPPRRAYTYPELEYIIKPPFVPKAHAEKVYESIRPYIDKGNVSTDLVKKLEYADKVLDALHLERGLFHELKQFALNARIKYGQHVPEIDQQLHRLAADIPRYLLVRQNIVNSILAPKQQQLQFPKKP